MFSRWNVRAQPALFDLQPATGPGDAGYEYVNIDDCWQAARDPRTGVIAEDRARFHTSELLLASR